MSTPIRDPSEPRQNKRARKRLFSAPEKRDPKQPWSVWDAPADGYVTSPRGHVADDDDDRGAGRRTF